MSFNYPEEIQKMINKNASYSMVGDLGRYQRSMPDGMPPVLRAVAPPPIWRMMMGMNVANQMMQNMNWPVPLISRRQA